MNDLIKRKDAIDAICEYCGICEGQYELCDDRKRLKALPSAQPGPQWTPVKERLPEPDDNTYYLVSQKDYNWLAVARYVTYRANNVWDDDEGLVVSDHVTAYMPLPQPYKEGQDGLSD